MPRMNEASKTGQIAPDFHEKFQARLRDLFLWRRDVRRFRRDPVPVETVEELLSLAVLAPSVGYSQPWRFVSVEDATRRAAIRDNFARCNADALAQHSGGRADLYARLKLEGLENAPVQLAVFCDEGTQVGHGLGRRTMPETLRYSVVMAVHTLWLAARARGIGVGWVSILDPRALVQTLNVPQDWSLVAYLCIGWPEEEHLDPELARSGWEGRQVSSETLLKR
jgi:5,6-dimethylbenzimidazole synthase